jgi:hypothetical protein
MDVSVHLVIYRRSQRHTARSIDAQIADAPRTVRSSDPQRIYDGLYLGTQADQH